MSVKVNNFKWEKGVNDLKYINLLEKHLKKQQQLTNTAISKLKQNDKLKHNLEQRIETQKRNLLRIMEYSEILEQENKELSSKIVKIDKAIEEIEKEAFPESVYGEQYSSVSDVISVDAVVEILKRNIGEEGGD